MTLTLNSDRSNVQGKCTIISIPYSNLSMVHFWLTRTFARGQAVLGFIKVRVNQKRRDDNISMWRMHKNEPVVGGSGCCCCFTLQLACQHLFHSTEGLLLLVKLSQSHRGHLNHLGPKSNLMAVVEGTLAWTTRSYWRGWEGCECSNRILVVNCPPDNRDQGYLLLSIICHRTQTGLKCGPLFDKLVTNVSQADYINSLIKNRFGHSRLKTSFVSLK